MSRKTIMAVLGVVGTVLVFLKEQFGLAIDATAIVAGLAAILLYVLFEAKLDIQRITAQSSKFKDPKFWLAFASALVVAVNESFGLNLPVEIIVTVLTAIMGLLFKKDKATVVI